MQNFSEMCKNIIKKLYDKYVLQSDKELNQNSEDVKNYENTEKENITAIVANTLAILAMSDKNISISGGSKRAKLLDEILQKELKNSKKIVGDGLGTGLIVSIPYSVDNGLGRKIYIDTVEKNSFFVTGIQGDDITDCTVISDYKHYKNSKYIRWTDYSIKDNTYIIRQRATRDGSEIPLTDTLWWGEIEEEIRIANVTQLPIGIFKCPTSNRRPKNINGVPITYGCEATLEKIAKTLSEIEDEFELKRTFVGASRDLFDKDSRLPKNGLFRLFDTDVSNEDMFTIFSPEIRESAYFTKLQNQFSILEKQIGCSRGVLTDMMTMGATATEVRKGMYNTFSICDDIHTAYMAYLDSLLYGINVLCNFYNLTPSGEYKIKYDWSYSLLEDTENTFHQLTEGHAMGAIATYEIRQFIKPDETEEEAKAKIKEISKEKAEDGNSIDDILDNAKKGGINYDDPRDHKQAPEDIDAED